MPPAPYVVDLVPGKLRARVHAHARHCGAVEIPCWTYLTDGLRDLGHREIALSIRRNPAVRRDGYPGDPLQVFVSIRQAATAGHRAEFGDYTQFSGTGFLGDAAVRGLGYLSPHPLDGSLVPPGTLVAVPLVGDELAVTQRHGLTRVTARIGQAYRYYPCPPWYDPGRPAYSRQDGGASILDGLTPMTVPASCALLRDGALLLRLPRSAAGRLGGPAGLSAIAAGAVIALYTQPDPAATACLVWQPGQDSPTAITPPGGSEAALTGGFVAFVPEQDADGVRVVEDGFAVMLRDESWQTLRDALVSGAHLTLADGALTLAWY